MQFNKKGDFSELLIASAQTILDQTVEKQACLDILTFEKKTSKGFVFN